MGALIVHDDILERIQQKLEKHEALMSYCRKHPSDHIFWDGVPEDIKTGALNWASKVEEMFPDEIDALRGEHSDWEYGFVSGVTAAFRYVLLAASEPEFAEDCWPDLDT